MCKVIITPRSLIMLPLLLVLMETAWFPDVLCTSTTEAPPCMSFTCICCGLRLLPAASSWIYSLSRRTLLPPPPPLPVSFSPRLFHRWVRRFVSPWDCGLRAGRRPAAEAGFNEAPTLLDLREVSQSSVAKSTDGLWDCFVLGPEPKMAPMLKPHWLVGRSNAGEGRAHPSTSSSSQKEMQALVNTKPLFQHLPLTFQMNI